MFHFLCLPFLSAVNEWEDWDEVIEHGHKNLSPNAFRAGYATKLTFSSSSSLESRPSLILRNKFGVIEPPPDEIIFLPPPVDVIVV